MVIKTKVDRKITVWETQEVWVEVRDEAHFEELRKEDNLESQAIDWGDCETLWETCEGTGEEDNEFSEIIEIIKD